MLSDQEREAITKDLDGIIERLKEGNAPPLCDPTSYIAMILTGAASRLLAGDFDPQILSQSLGNGLGSLIG
jgi:hypothetical protein